MKHSAKIWVILIITYFIINTVYMQMSIICFNSQRLSSDHTFLVSSYFGLILFFLFFLQNIIPFSYLFCFGLPRAVSKCRELLLRCVHYLYYYKGKIFCNDISPNFGEQYNLIKKNLHSVKLVAVHTDVNWGIVHRGGKIYAIDSMRRK